MAMPSQDTLRRAELVFRATVEKAAASTMPEVPASNRTVVVSVTEVFRAPEVLRFLAGRSITVVATDARPLQPGQEALFLATPWLYGSSLAVIEVGRETEAVDFKGLPQNVSADAQSASDTVLAERLRGASLVVSGRVTEIRPPGAIDPLTVSEHTPQWAEAVIEVSSVEKGTSPGPRVTVLYPESRDVMWHRAPKLQNGQQGVFILRSGAVEGVERAVLTALDPLDVHASDALDRVRRLIRAGG